MKQPGRADKKPPSVSAKAKAVSLLSRREHSTQELKSKLLQRGYPAEEVDDAVQWVHQHRFQSDERFAESLFRRRSATFGDRAIAAELSSHGLGARNKVTQSEVAGAAYVDEVQRAVQWVLKRHAGPIRDALAAQVETADKAQLLLLKSRVFKALASRGFDFDNIEAAWVDVLRELNSQS